jgi:long-chain acyl-CoA synthetase
MMTLPFLRHAEQHHPHEVRGATIVDLFRDAARSRPDATALRFHDGTEWVPITWRSYEEAVAETAAGLRAWGLEPGDRVGLLSGNRPQWHIADLGMLSAGLVSTPVYSTSSSSQIAHVLNDSGARMCFVEDGQQLAKVLLRREGLPLLERVIMLGPLDGADDGFVHTLDELRRDGAERLAAEPGAFDAMINAVAPTDLATLVYTSGTTGPPKGAVISHGNIMATLRSLTSLIDLRPTDRFLSFLPLSHITERSVSHFGQVASGGETWFARSLGTVPDDLRACRPTLFFAVPRVWEKFHESIVDTATHTLPPVGPVLRSYLDIAARRGDGTLVWGSTADHVAYQTLRRTIGRLLRYKLGLDRTRLLSSGAAPVHPDLLRWFAGIGLEIAEGYGQTEVTLCTTLNPLDDIRIGSVGRPIPGVELRIADDGEILVRAPNVCAGYWGNPAATAELIDPDGWLHTGDLGSVDPDGYLHISGRKKDLIITAYGKNIAPAELELALRQEPLISNAVVVGDDRPYLTALVTLDPEAAVEWAAREGRTLALESLVVDEGMHEAIDEAIERVNGMHSHAEGIRRWRLLPHDLSVATSELTPTLKVRREVVATEHAELIEEMYAEQSV